MNKKDKIKFIRGQVKKIISLKAEIESLDLYEKKMKLISKKYDEKK